MLQQVLLQVWDKWPKCFSDQFVSTKNDQNVSAQKKTGCMFSSDKSPVHLSRSTLK